MQPMHAPFSPQTSTLPHDEHSSVFAEQGAGAQLPPRVSASIGLGSFIFSVPATLAVGRQWLSLVVRCAFTLTADGFFHTVP